MDWVRVFILNYVVFDAWRITGSPSYKLYQSNLLFAMAVRKEPLI